MTSITDDTVTIQKTWVAYGPAGVVGAIHRLDGGYTFRLVADDVRRQQYPTLQVAQRALHASLLPGAEWPEFREH